MPEHPFARTVRLAARIALAPLTAAVVFFSIVSDPVRMDSILFFDKVKHLAAYAALGFAAVTAFAAAGRRVKTLLLSVAGCAALGAALEIVQGITGRTPDLTDEICNLAGALAGGALALIPARLSAGRRGAPPNAAGE